MISASLLPPVETPETPEVEGDTADTLKEMDSVDSTETVIAAGSKSDLGAGNNTDDLTDTGTLSQTPSLDITDLQVMREYDIALAMLRPETTV